MGRFDHYLAREAEQAQTETNKSKSSGRFAKYAAELDADAAALSPEPKPEGVRTLPMSPERKAKLQEKIAAGMLPLPGGLRSAGEAAVDAFDAAGQAFGDQALFGLPNRVSEAVLGPRRQVEQIPERGKKLSAFDRLEDRLPAEATLASVPAAATDMATMGGTAGRAGQALGQMPAQVARKLGASEAQVALRPAIQTTTDAAGAGAVYGASDAAMRGGDATDIAEGAIQGAAGNALMSQIPVAAGKVADAAKSAMTTRAVKPLVGIGQGVKADKALAGLGKGDVEIGEKELRRVVEDEGLAPIVNSKASKMGNAFDAKLDEVWQKELGPVRVKALQAEPDAAVSVRKIEDKLRELIGKENAGTDVHDDVDKAIALIKARAEKMGNKSSFPVENLLKNAQEFERDGFGKSQPKFADGATARAIGKALRTMTDERIGQIYVKNPKLVREVLRIPEPTAEPRLLPTGADNPDYIPPKRLAPWQRSEADELNLDILGDRYAAARKRYADLKKLEPLVDQLAKRRAEHRPGLIATMKHGVGNLTAGALGYGVAGHKGLVGAMLAAEATRLGMPLAERAAFRLTKPFSGPAADPLLSGAVVSRKGDQ